MLTVYIHEKLPPRKKQDDDSGRVKKGGKFLLDSIFQETDAGKLQGPTGAVKNEALPLFKKTITQEFVGPGIRTIKQNGFFI